MSVHQRGKPAKPKVYVVTSGCYSDYSIEAIFTNRQAAKRFVGLDEDDDGYGRRIEVRDLLTTVPQKVTRHYMKLEPDGQATSWETGWWPWELLPNHRKPVVVDHDAWWPLHSVLHNISPEEAIEHGFPFALAQPSGRIVCLNLLISGTDEEAVKKSFYDRLAIRKAEVEGIAS